MLSFTRLHARNSFIIFLSFIAFSLASLAWAESPADSAPVSTKADLAQAVSVQNAFRFVAKTVQPAIVEINVTITQTAQDDSQDDFPWRFFFGDNPGEKPKPRKYQEQGLGSGIIVRRDGGTYYVLTNNHVAGSADKITIRTYDGKEYKGSLVGKDSRKDLALVKFSSGNRDIAVATLGDSSALQVGDWAIAIGSPYGLVSSVTAGIVSALGRTGGPDGNISDFIQTDAAINRGNSGGALVNIHGEVVGINTWIASESGGNVGLGFAIPINNAKKVIEDFLSYGKVRYGWLGASLETLDRASASELGADPDKGAFVANIYRHGPAEKGGVHPGDVVLSLNGVDISGVDQLVRLVGDLPTGKDADFLVLRDGKTLDLKVDIEPRDEKVVADGRNLFPGVDAVSINDEDLDKTALPKGVAGVVVVKVQDKSTADIVGLQQGDLITKIGDKDVRNLRDYYRCLSDSATGKVVFTILRDGVTLTTPAVSVD
jgi:Do/DeqQ family serine protease